MTTTIAPQNMTPPFPEYTALMAMVGASGARRARMIDDFMRSKMLVFKSIGNYLCGRAGLDTRRHSEDATSLVMVRCMILINDLIDEPIKITSITQFDGYLASLSKSDIRSYADGASSGERPSGAVSRARRTREIAKTRTTLRAELDREPTQDEIIEATNERMHRLRKNPARQSMLVSRDDFTAATTAPLYEDTDLPYEDRSEVIEADEARKTLDTIAHAAGQVNPVLEKIAYAWLAPVYDPEQLAPRTPSEVARLCAISPASASRFISAVKEIAAQVIPND